MIKLAYSIMDASGIYAGMKSDISVFAENFSLAEGTFEKGFMFTGFNTTPDRLLVAKLADGADVDAVKEAIETDRQAQEDTFSWYLAHNLPKVEAAQVVVNGDYVLYVIGETAETQPDEDEFLNVELVDVQELVDAVLDGKIEDAKTVVGALACDVMAHRLAADDAMQGDEGSVA